ncbi:uncharacterized protein LOC127279642 [Leptopilina boulardi]|uniref:uncharacterized protein LOC127279642 n=1 Tax=Leptopilina boulardi TaxID=63433 RepID=UPI0021F542AD|nr:uncharacterized protein LOC127279642 [Leptopilina boulardi]
MKILKEGVLFLFILIQINSFCLAENLINHAANEKKNEEFSNRIILNDFSIKSSISELFKYFDYLEIINEFIEPKIKRLCIVIAKDIKDSIKLAELLSNKNRLLPEKKQNFSETKNLIYNEIMQNYYLYYHKELSAHIIVYPTEMQNKILATYLIKRTIDSSEELKVALTCSKEVNEDNLNSMFMMASNILDFNREQHNLKHKIIFLPLDVNDQSKFTAAKNNLENYFYKKFERFGNSLNVKDLLFSAFYDYKNLTKKEQLEYIVIGSLLYHKAIRIAHIMINLHEHPQRILMSTYEEDYLTIYNYIQTTSNLIKIRTFAFSYDGEILDLLKNRYPYMEPSSVDVSSLKGVLTFPDWVTKNSNISKRESQDNEVEKFINNVCNRTEQIEVVKHVCFMKYMNYDKPEKLLNYMQNFTIDYYLREEKELFSILSSMYKTENSKETGMYKSQDLYEKIEKIDGQKKDLMLEAFFAVNNFLNPEAEHLCSQIGNGTYKLQVRGKFLIVGQILRKKYCSGNVTILELLALDKIVINEDLVSDKVQLVIIMAPIWEIVWNRVIRLTGAPGDNNWRPYKYEPDYSTDPVRLDGLDGVRGGPGGSFFGIANTIIKDKNLYISTIGGRGGDGQNGADGLVYERNPGTEKQVHSPGIKGNAGKGGIPGLVQFFPLNNINFNISISQTNGSVGTPGDDGIMNKVSDFFLNFLLRRERMKINFDSYLIDEPKGINNLTSTLMIYRKYVLKNMLKTGKQDYADLYGKLNTNVNLTKNLNTLVFADELFYLEENNYLILNKSILYTMYLGLQNGLALYKGEPQRLGESDDDKTFLSKLEHFIVKKTGELYGNLHNQAVVKINDFIGYCKENGEKLRKLEISKKFEEVSTKFKKEFQKQIDEASKLIKNNLEVIVDKKFNDLNKEIEKLVDEVKVMIKKGNEAVGKLKEKKKELEFQIALRKLFTIFKFIIFGLSFINPVCATIGSALSGGLSILETNYLTAEGDKDYEEFKIPEAVTKDVKSSFTKYDEETKKEYEEVEKQLKEIKSEKEKLSVDEAKPLNDMVQEVTKKCTPKVSFPKKCMMEILEKKENELTTQSVKQKKSYKTSLKIVKGAEISLDVVNLGLENYNSIKKDASEIEKIDEQIDKQKKNIKKLEEFQTKIYKNLQPQIEDIRKQLRETSKGYVISSTALLEYKRFEMGEYLNKISSELDSWTKQFNVSQEIKDTMGQLKAAMNTIIQMHTLIKDFESQKRQADFVTDVASVPFKNTNIKDPKLVEILTKLENIHYSNTIIDEYNKLAIAMKGYAYPFLKDFSDFFSSPSMLFNSYFIKPSNLVDKIYQLDSKLKSRRSHGAVFKQFKAAKFGIPGGHSAFYTWKNSTHSSYIKDILEGKVVELFANISQEPGLNAVKFQNIEILFSSSDNETNVQLKEDFKEFQILFTHNGDSYYRCSDKVHVIKSGTYGSVFEPITSKRNKRQASNIDYVLSPFATWRVQLEPIRNGHNFDSLAKYVNKVNLELVGEGQYLLANKNICNEYFE